MVVCFRRSSLASVLHTCLGFEPVSSVAFLCIQMAGPTKRLRRKMTVSHSDCSELLMLTSEFWLQFAFPAGRYLIAYQKTFRQGVKWRLLCKAWREVWDQGWRVTLRLQVDNVWMLCQAAQCYGDILLRRDRDNEVIYDHRLWDSGGCCLVSMPWKTFKGLRPLLVLGSNKCAFCKLILKQPRGFVLLGFVQTSFNCGVPAEHGFPAYPLSSPIAFDAPW